MKPNALWLLLPFLLAACSRPEAGAYQSAETLPPAGCAEVVRRIDPELAASLDAVVDEARALGFDGQVAVMRGDDLVYSRASGFADSDETVPVTTGTWFQISSTVKYITAILVLQAADAGRLDLDARLDRWFPGSRIAARGTTINNLLAHRSGLGASYAAEEHANAEDAWRAIDDAEFDNTRIGRFRYSNDGYDLLGIILEQAYGQRYETIARELLFDPACIEVGFWGEAQLSDPATIAQPEDGFPESLVGRNYGMLGSAGLLISAEDLLRLQVHVRESGLLSGRTRDALFEPRGAMSLGQATYGGFWLEIEGLGRMHSARGTEDWGDSTYLDTFPDCGLILAITASSGQTRDGRYFRDVLFDASLPVLRDYCAAD